MLTIDDINSINEKYGDIGFWYKIDLTKIPAGEIRDYDFIKISNESFQSTAFYKFKIDKYLFHGVHYFMRNGTVINLTLLESSREGEYNYTIQTTAFPDLLCLFLTLDDSIDVSYNFGEARPMISPKNGLCIPIINGIYDDKFYFDIIRGTPIGYTIDGADVEAETDEEGTFLRLPSSNNCVIGVKSSSKTYPMYKVIFEEFKSLPILSIPMMYANNKQQIQLLNSETGEYITDFQAYYKGELLVDNIWNVPSVSEGENGYIPITIDLLDNRYPNCTLKLKAPIKSYLCRTQQEVETALEEGLTYFRIRETTIIGMEFDNVSLTLHGVSFKNCSFNNCETRWSQQGNYDQGGNLFNNCIISGYNTTNTHIRNSGTNSKFNNCIIEALTFRDYDLDFTGTIKDCRMWNTIIISDGDIEITGTNFYRRQTRKTYFPAFLYLTGDYIVSDNTFNLTGTFTELSFNMCLIKATNDFNVGEFINKNTFQLNIEYETEPTSTLYYNIVDDDKIRARRI